MNNRPRYRLKRKARMVFIILLLCALMTGGSLYVLGYFDPVIEQIGSSLGIKNEAVEEKDSGFHGRLNVLLLGTDARKGEKTARADTIMLFSVDTEKNLLSVLSIPRDTRVQIPGHGWEKINAAMLYGGPELAMRVVSDLVDAKVDNYLITNYDGFKKIINTLGGVTINVEERMIHDDPQDGGIYAIDLEPGLQRLNGEKALQYVRYRGYALGDISRTEHQQKFLAALKDEVLKPGTVIKLPSLLVNVFKAVETNLSLSEMRSLAVAAGKMTDANMVSQTLPGKFLNNDQGSFWEVDPAQARQILSLMNEGKVPDKVVMGVTEVASGKQSGQSNGVAPVPDAGAVVPDTQDIDQASKPGEGQDSKKTPGSADNKTGDQADSQKTDSGSNDSGQVLPPPAGGGIIPDDQHGQGVVLPPSSTTLIIQGGGISAR